MTRKKLVLSEEALSDLNDIWDYIADNDLKNADRFIDLLYEKCRKLGATPEIGRNRPELGEGLRSFPVGSYVIFYRIKKSVLEIVRVLSGYRNIERLF